MLVEEILPNIRPATLFEDNTGCIFLTKIMAVRSRTKHIDIKMHHIREMMQGNQPHMRISLRSRSTIWLIL